MPRGGYWVVLLTLFLVTPLLPAPSAAGEASAQGGPPVTFEDVTHERLLLADDGPERIRLSAEVGCRTEDAGGGSWRATFSVPHTPASVQARIQPTSLIWEHAPSQCQASGGHRVTTSVFVTRGPGSRAFEPATFPVALFLDREPREGGSQGYGAYLANVTVTPGFLGDAWVSRETAPSQVRPGEAAEVTLEVLNRGNGATSFQAVVPDPPAGDGQPVRSGTIELQKGERGEVTVEVVMPELGPWAEERVRVEVLVEGVAVDERARPEVNTTSVVMHLRVVGAGAEVVPGPSIGLVALAVGLAAVLGMRVRWR